MDYDVTDGAYPLLRVRLAPTEVLEAEVRAFVGLVGEAEIKSVGLKLSKRTLKAAIGGKKSSVSNRFTAVTETKLMFTSGVAGEILAVRTEAARPLRAGPGSYIASEGSVELDVEVVKLTRTSRMPLLRFVGDGRVFLGASGSIHATGLAADETMTLDRVHLLACDGSLTIEDVSEKGLWPTLTGQDLVQLTGPGRVFVQSLPRSVRSSPLSEAVKGVSGLL